MNALKKIETALKYCLFFLSVALVCVLLPAIREDYKAYLTKRTIAGKETMAGEEMDVNSANLESLPFYYDARENKTQPVVKDQGNLGTCWAVAASSSLEANLLPEQQLVFSADHMSLNHGFQKAQNDGGDYTMIMAYLASWKGPVLEEDDPYGDGRTDTTLQPVKHIQEMQILEDADVQTIKEAVYRYGSVQASIYMDLENAFSSSVYYNQLDCSYYYRGEEEGNHDLVIIGWDDRYPASSFHVNTEHDGAFICQNSWGEQFGEEGVFYVSYQDVTLGKHCIVYSKIEETDNYDHIYQTDLCGWAGKLGYGDSVCYFANTFQVQRREQLQAVGFYATGKDTDYEVYLLDQEEELSHAVVEETVAVGHLDYAGYYTIELENGAELEEGREITVVIKINTPGEAYPVATEYAADAITAEVELSDGDGYISHNGLVWKNTESTYSCNVCMKLYTVDE